MDFFPYPIEQLSIPYVSSFARYIAKIVNIHSSIADAFLALCSRSFLIIYLGMVYSGIIVHTSLLPLFYDGLFLLIATFIFITSPAISLITLFLCIFFMFSFVLTFIWLLLTLILILFAWEDKVIAVFRVYFIVIAKFRLLFHKSALFDWCRG